jgi:predicted nucleotidyltransferase component of viral defense system
MHQESLSKNTKSVLETLSKSEITKDFYLAGGTALALYLGHRFSVDLDWFSKDFNYNLSFRRKLETLGKLGIDSEAEDTFNGTLNGVKVSFFRYPYPLISQKTKYKNFYIAGMPDIAVMKLEAISNRGGYKDFIDIYFLLQKYSLEEMLGFVRKKFTNIDYNEAHLLKSLTYFESAKNSPKPKLIKKVIWQEVTDTIKRKTEKYLQGL